MGVYVAYVYVIEFQKRGLPHAHMLIWLEESDKILDPAAIDRLISAEFPDPIAHANLHELVKVHMLHGPCTSARCLDEEGHCSKQFPKSLREDTLYNPSGYPLYKRRPIETPIHIGRRTVDNSWVVPYNAYLLEKYEAHINVEACSSMKSVKYLLKYIYKGFDRAQIVVRTVEEDGQTTTIQEPMYNEIQMFLDVRYVSAPEAMWRIYTFEMHDMSHAIIKLFVHLPNMQQVYFNTNSTIPDVVERAATQHTTLTGWFALNTQDEEARQYTYVQIPYNYVWKITQTRIWVERQRHFNRIIPRLYFVHPREGERFYLRQRLLHKTGCRSFEDISTVHGRTYETFRDAAIAMNLLTDDSIWFTMLQEAIHVQLPRALRHYIRRLNDNDLAYNYALAYINRYLALQGKSNRDFQLLLPTEPVEHLIEDEYDYDQSEEQEIANRNIPLLNQEQRRIFTDILLAVNENERVSHRLFFIKGIGGAGKTFLLNTLLTYLLGNNHRYIAICYTGIPASLLINGQTIHPAFMLPVPFLENSTSRIRNQSAIADNIRYSKIIVIDEISMVHKSIFNEIGRKIREIMNNDIPLGGKIIIILGDFRQCAPIVPLAGKNETISASVKCSQLWQHFVKYDLLTNVRALPQQNEFKDWLMTIGNNSEILRHLENGRDTIVKVPNHIIVENVTESIYGSNLIEHDFR
ncbi:unnamed protein product [Acanthoscelides obtectus]|uniref:ATP-dependent DNA helicase n=1 Tax=Acanthoscelides obtectus TaxID=200917 RepID=A0A9P0QJZ7_ACAOB|nr:unnamed protein product [Acanthoscelides obtectus]CAK1627013.1 ATP-dependent DNA helicase RRM3 [Acanthoscelides obtectus]